MDAQVWTSLLGVALGGGFSFLAQITAGRQAGRSEARRRQADVAEARRAERLELLQEFIALAQQGVRLAEQREGAGGDWETAATAEWRAAALGLIDRMWVCERMIGVVFPADFYRRAWAYGTAVDQVLWREYAHAEVSLHDHVRGAQLAFLEAARAQLGR
ncbi:hypothetical protein OG539_05470 [Actinacidiphila glaucinigra]|uniref:hypothetical protein n=1 Tax=Actinacidiphila glaucinigra TaxID=235986 RepID=UPI002DDB5FD4|nr:hypothetical protein [Actinacidiphila glaucinigra]WSD64162.1 hypothetical protein OIE69_37395 [Actinacidiphila glaucinigra]